MKKVFEPVTKSLKDVSEDLTKTITESSIENNNTRENLNNKLLELLNNRGIKSSYLLSPLSKITNLDNTSQYKILKNPNSNRVNDLLSHDTIPITLFNDFLTFRHTGKEVELKGDLLKLIIIKTITLI